MDRRLEKLSLKDLQVKVRQYGLKPNDDRDGCIDQIMTHFERTGPLLDFREEDTLRHPDNIRPPGLTGPEDLPASSAAHVCSPESSNYRSGPSEGTFPQLCAIMANCVNNNK